MDFLSRLWRVLGLDDFDDEAIAFAEPDLQAVRLIAGYRAAGLDEDTLCRISQVLGHGLSRLSETIIQIVGEALLQAGDSEQTLGLRYAQATQHLIPPLTPLMSYVLDVHFKDQIKSAFISQTELLTGRVENARDITVCFADLVGFTRLGERVPPEELSNAGRLLTELVIEVARPPVRLVKMIGDAAMLVSPDPKPLIDAALALVAKTESHRQTMPPLRVGIAQVSQAGFHGDWVLWVSGTHREAYWAGSRAVSVGPGADLRPPPVVLSGGGWS